MAHGKSRRFTTWRSHPSDPGSFPAALQPQMLQGTALAAVQRGSTMKGRPMTARQALAVIRKHGVVLESAAGPVPSLAAVVAGEPLHGSWWGHPRGREIFAVTRAVREAEDVLVCRLIEGKITYVHRRLWPALVRIAPDFPKRRLAQVKEIHRASGRHVTSEIAFPKWVPTDVLQAASHLSGPAARRQLGPWC